MHDDRPTVAVLGRPRADAQSFGPTFGIASSAYTPFLADLDFQEVDSVDLVHVDDDGQLGGIDDYNGLRTHSAIGNLPKMIFKL